MRTKLHIIILSIAAMSAFLSGAAYGELYAQSNEITVTGKVLD